MGINNRQSRVIFSVCVFFLYLTGCAFLGQGESKIRGDDIVIIQPQELQDKILVHDVNAFVVDDLLGIQVAVESQSSELFELTYQVRWFSIAGFRIDAQRQDWTTLVLNVGEIKAIQATSGSAMARKYQILLRIVEIPK